MAHPYFVAKARARFAELGGDPNNAGPLAEWAEEAKQIGDARRGVIVADDGELVAETYYCVDHPDRPKGSYVKQADARRYDLVGNETSLATAQLRRILGKKVVHVTMAEVCRGAGAHIKEVNAPLLEPVCAAADEKDGSELVLKTAIANAYSQGATPSQLHQAAGVTRQTIYRWLRESGFKIGADNE